MLPSFEVGRTYHRQEEIHGPFGGQQQGGISTPKSAPYIFLFTWEGGQKYGYHDGWTQDGVFLYSGEGQTGDMQFVRGNLAIRNHAADGKVLELFEALGKGQGYRYMGQFACSTWENGRGAGLDGVDRETIIFHLVPMDDLKSQVPEISDKGTLAELRSKAYGAATEATPSTESDARRLIYMRSALVRNYVLRRAGDHCESCRQPAPFRRPSGSPYLEPHHTRRVADGGPDHPRWVGAVCPNCHREIHFGEGGATKNQQLEEYLGTVEQDFHPER